MNDIRGEMKCSTFKVNPDESGCEHRWVEMKGSTFKVQCSTFNVKGLRLKGYVQPPGMAFATSVTSARVGRE